MSKDATSIGNLVLVYSFGDPSPVKRQLFRLTPGLSV